MKRDGIPITRKNYIEAAWGYMPSDDEWTPEHEAMLPEHLQEG